MASSATSAGYGGGVSQRVVRWRAVKRQRSERHARDGAKNLPGEVEHRLPGRQQVDARLFCFHQIRGPVNTQAALTFS
jgi:hypothetical protein